MSGPCACPVSAKKRECLEQPLDLAQVRLGPPLVAVAHEMRKERALVDLPRRRVFGRIDLGQGRQGIGEPGRPGPVAAEDEEGCGVSRQRVGDPSYNRGSVPYTRSHCSRLRLPRCRAFGSCAWTRDPRAGSGAEPRRRVRDPRARLPRVAVLRLSLRDLARRRGQHPCAGPARAPVPRGRCRRDRAATAHARRPPVPGDRRPLRPARDRDARDRRVRLSQDLRRRLEPAHGDPVAADGHAGPARRAGGGAALRAPLPRAPRS